MTKTNQSATRAAWIDCARVLATLLIVVYHLPSSNFHLTGMSLEIWQGCLMFFRNPAGALCFFFVLAGYFSSRHMTWRKWRAKWLLLFSSFLLWNAIFALGLSEALTFERVYGIGANSVICADYPLWFVRDILLMLFFFPLMRRYPLLLMLLCASLALIHERHPFAFFVENPSFPATHNWFFFTLGFYLNRFSMDAIKEKMRLIALPLSVVLVAASVSSFYRTDILAFPFANLVLPLAYAGFIASIGLVFDAWAPRKLMRVVLSLAPCTFLCYALHAGIILAVSRIFSSFAPALNSHAWVPLCLALLIMPISYMCYRAIRAYCPILLPLLCNERLKK